MIPHIRLESGRVFARVREVPWIETVASSHERGWTGLSAALICGNVSRRMHWESTDTILAFLLSGSAVIEWKQENVLRHRHWTSGSICLFTGWEQHDIRCSGQIVALTCAFSPQFLAEAVRLQCGCNHREHRIPNRIGFQHRDLWRLAGLMRSELASQEPPNRALQGLLNLAIGDYLLRNSAACRKCRVCTQAHRGGPGLHSERVFDAIQKAVAFIAHHLGEDGLSIERIATAAGLSTYHFARTFRAALGIPPHRYIVERRVDRARELLEWTDLTPTEVAMYCGFSSQSHLTSTFRQILETTPLAYRRTHRQDASVRDKQAQKAS